jgi:hypothetical protein
MKHTLALLCLACVPSLPANAQDSQNGLALYSFTMPGGHQDFAETFSRPADFDGDGSLEILVANDGSWGAPNEVRIHSLVDGSLLLTLSDGANHWGHAVEVVGDITGDGIDDYLVGAPQANGNRGLAELRSGADHSVVRTHLAAGTAYDDRYANTLGALGDVNGDSVPDYFITASSEDPVGSSAHYVGSIRHYSGTDGAVLSHVMGNGGSHYAGHASPGRDLDGDGGYEVINGSAAGYVRLHDDAGGVISEYQTSPSMSYVSGRATSDHDGDGVLDLVLWGDDSGRLEIISTQTWSVVSTIPGTTQFPFSSTAPEGAGNLEVLPDLDGDGFEDFAYGESAMNRVAIISSRSGALLDAIDAPTGSGTGFGHCIRYFEETGQLLVSHVSSALYVYELQVEQDCNGNGVPDPDDIAAGTSSDCNTNGIPDECETVFNTSSIVHVEIPSGSSDVCGNPPCLDNVWSMSAPPFPLDTSIGVGFLVRSEFDVLSDVYVLHDHVYAAPYVPDPARAVVTYEFAVPTVVDQIEVTQSGNGITQIEGFVGDSASSLLSIGQVFGPDGDVTGPAHFVQGAPYAFSFNNQTPGLVFRFVVTKTNLADGYAAFRAYPCSPDGTRIPAAGEDADGDGFDTNVDCDDGDPLVNPAAMEVCDGLDNDCDGFIDGPCAVGALFWWPDIDQDGFGDSSESPVVDCSPPLFADPLNPASLSFGVADNTDCDDSDPLVNPAAGEICCNGVDDDCDGLVDNLDVCAGGVANSNYCTASPNSVSPTGATIWASGSSSVIANDLVLMAGPVPVQQFGLFFHAAVQVQFPFGDGFQCAAGGLVRVWPATPADGAGTMTKSVNLSGPDGTWIAPGVTRNFQLWYRDPAGGPNGHNLSDGLAVCFY